MDLSICIVNWNTGDLLRDCIKSIIQNTHEISYEIIVVDNDSSDNSIELLKPFLAEVNHLRLIEAGRNLGFAGGNNVALDHASGEFIVLLNPDTLVTAGALDLAVKLLKENPAWGILGPKLLNGDGSLQPSIGQFPTLTGMFWEMTRLRKLFPRIRLFSSFKRYDMDYDKLQDVEQPSGACLFVRSAAIERVGLLDLRYFMYYEEVDWCFRIHNAGWRIVYTPNIKVVHLGGQSSIKNLDVRIVEYARSLLRYFHKHYGSRPLYLVGLRLVVVLEMLLKLAVLAAGMLLHPKDFSARWSVARRHLHVLAMALGLRPA